MFDANKNPEKISLLSGHGSRGKKVHQIVFFVSGKLQCNQSWQTIAKVKQKANISGALKGAPTKWAQCDPLISKWRQNVCRFFTMHSGVFSKHLFNPETFRFEFNA